MKKKTIGVLIAGLIGACPLSAYAINDNLYIRPGKSLGVISQQLKLDHHKKHEDNHEKDHDRKERERREQERREQERREWERKEYERRKQEQDDARHVIKRTAVTIHAAQRSVKRGHYYKGLAYAVAHQQKARQLYMAGFYREAIFHSLRARRIAILVIQGNKEKWTGSWDAREEWYCRISPRDNDLDVKLNLIKIGDKEAVRISIDLDL